MRTRSISASGSQLDGAATDACGNVYVLRTDGRISRIRANGEIEPNYLRLPESPYTSSLHFGSGIGGWEKDHLYVMERTGILYDIPVGIPGAWEPHLPK